MPQRFLRPGITTSEKFNSVDWQTQIFYVRLLTLVDDFGRYDANSRLLASHVFPLGDHEGNSIQLKTIENICEQLISKQLINLYEVNCKKYLQIENWQERPRAEKSKYPDCEQLKTNVRKCSLPSSSSSSSSSSFDQFWYAYPKKVAKGEALKAWSKAKTDIATVLPALNKAKSSEDWKKESGRFIPHPATWLNQRRWEDETLAPAIIVPNLPDTRPEDVFGALRSMSTKEE